MERRAFIALAAAGIAMPDTVWAAGRAALDWSQLDARLAERVRRGYFDGIGLIIGSAEGVLHERYFGNSTANTVLHVASVGKWSAAAAIAAVVDSGTLHWDDPVRKFLPQFSDGKGEATLRQLLSHTAGYPDYKPAGAPRDSYQTLAQSVEQIAGLPALAPPGSVFQYGGLALQVAGRMAEIADGRDFNTIFQSRIAAPLGMDASGYAPVSQEEGFSPMLGGGLFTSARDYAAFLAMMARGGVFRGRRVLSRAAIAEMSADQLRGAVLKPMEYVEQARADRRKDVYGLGQWREETDAQGRATLLSSPGWAGAYAWVDKSYGVWGMVLAKARVAEAVADGYNTFLGSSIYAPMVRSAIDEQRQSQRQPRRQSQRQPRVLRRRVGPLYVEESGRGEALIFLHGHSFDRRQWAPQIAAFEQQYRVIRYDLRGYGRSDLPSEQEPFLHADDLLTLMDGLQLKQAHLVGLSLGGFVVTDFLAMHPERVRSAVMAGGDFFDVAGPDEPWTAAAIAARREQIAALRQQGLFAFKRAWFDGLIANAGGGRDALRLPLWRMIDEWQAWQPLHVEPRLVLGRSVRKYLSRQRPQAPVLIIRGDREQATFALQDLLPQAKQVVIADCGHVSNLDQPASFTRVLQRFLATQT